MADENSTGIYKIRNLVNQKIYIGSAAISFKDRWQTKHIRQLRLGQHINRHLQSAWSLDGEEKFKFEIVEEISSKGLTKEEFKKNLLEREQYWLDFYKSYDPNVGYNICSQAGNTLGYKYTDEQKEKLSVWQRGELARSAKLNWNQVREIREIYANTKISISQLSEKYGISSFSIGKILHNRSWKDEKYEGVEIDYSARSQRAILTRENVNKIREDYKNVGIPQKVLAKQYNVSISTIKRIIQNKIWIDKNYDYDPSIGTSRRGWATTPNTNKENKNGQ